ncbi:GTP pyrophosphokinase family protein [Mycetocola lacteus]|uniref:GTP pyrophosphokinase family protein n=1 Tax=Mycetocola lacteus TaxID=76637 RepID=A0A3L7ATT4_9MICO|nr:GTP pyrophosphokinase family protein [Mycetocola lacteus]RLP83846.1 GTP pyrophosphokinase family protein [Mycetocola lacteus]
MPLPSAAERKILGQEMTRMMMAYRFGLDEISTKIKILRDEFTYVHEYNPIEHVSSRVKSPASIIEKAKRRGIEHTVEALRREVRDIAGIRITCSFVPDIYTVADLITNQQDVTVIEVRDYIKNPKPNGYQSLHVLVEVPVFLSDRVESVPVEIQIRTVAMDFWASLEHKIYYKFEKDVPGDVLAELKEAAETAAALDRKMLRLREQVRYIDAATPSLPEHTSALTEATNLSKLFSGLLEETSRGE